MTLTAHQLAALRDLDEVWPGVNTVIIGATALGCFFDMQWRRTVDVDLVIALEIDEVPGALIGRAGWVQHPRKEHELVSPHGVKIDLLPAGASLMAAGQIQWPSGQVMSLAGMDLAFQHAQSHAALGDCVARVAPPAVIAMLKMASFNDRPAERERDLSDIAHLLDRYVEDDSERRWDEALEIEEFDLAPAYLLGLDIGRIASTETHQSIIDSFLERVADPESASHDIMSRSGPSRWRTEVDALSRRFHAFRAGIAAG
ncbi:MAG TPA: nucleotidyl transferase AbiEii/AbiGii toxin family protein [Kofleriaceae bacterium]|nr:nucleotidyl transferase AbiEii/AbiGii toxin family protein [Kofleriaceae bacterium]